MRTDFRSDASKSMKTFPASRPLWGALVPLAFLIAACSPKAPEAPKAPAGPAGKLGTAVVAGRVTLEGAPPLNTRVTMATDPFCNGQHPGETELPEVAVGPDGALENVLLRVTEGASGVYAAPAEAKTLDQKGCAYSPRVLAIMTGQPLEIVSSDATIHNVHAASKENRAFNLGMPAPGTRYTRTFEKAEIVPFRCDVHPWMRAFVAVVPHPFFAVTGADGRFEIRGLPAGTYTVEAWHEKLPAQSFTLTLADGEAATRDVAFSAVPPA